ncbi:Lipopolysaccharide-induced tumor necrosis factor-alpha factor [Clonorchis sinensis]|uniref:Lipopolysaccharide-induced tumor necrosis factor-alpha factor n=1 Tax=Clonorchis sinensis TaxID=79923 RepID=A0A3R7FRL4_CLOSI|nr:Lipopolysaccharide-induced tumor necrosis factor-alpha factor [Clonorchis sinensis]
MRPELMPYHKLIPTDVMPTTTSITEQIPSDDREFIMSIYIILQLLHIPLLILTSEYLRTYASLADQSLLHHQSASVMPLWSAHPRHRAYHSSRHQRSQTLVPVMAPFYPPRYHNRLRACPTHTTSKSQRRPEAVVITAEPVSYPEREVVGRDPYVTYCPQCFQMVLTRTDSQAGELTFICFIFLLCFIGPFALLACLFDTCKDVAHFCPVCGEKISTYRALRA